MDKSDPHKEGLSTPCSIKKIYSPVSHPCRAMMHHRYKGTQRLHIHTGPNPMGALETAIAKLLQIHGIIIFFPRIRKLVHIEEMIKAYSPSLRLKVNLTYSYGLIAPIIEDLSKGRQIIRAGLCIFIKIIIIESVISGRKASDKIMPCRYTHRIRRICVF